jgi:hypothetical protein
MSISVEKLSLLNSLAPLRLKTDFDTIPTGNGFAEKLDKALGNADATISNATVQAREMAESLSLQMLQSSLALAGDSPAESSPVFGSASFSSSTALLQAYRANLDRGEQTGTPLPVTPPSQLQDLTETAPADHRGTQMTKTGTDTSWLDPIITRASQKYGVDVGLIKAVIKAESNFNPNAVSHAGARGLMQLMPATARSLGVSDSYDPEQNVMGGTRFLKDMIQRYNGNVDAALAAYNWGPGNVDKRPDHLPRETRDYLTRVKQLYASYGG